MAENVSQSLIRWAFAWAELDVSPTANSTTTGQLELWVADEVVWAGGEFEWNWIELLEWLNGSWRWLIVEDGLPLALSATRFSELVLHDGLQSEDDHELLWEFLEFHDLRECLRGAWSPAALLIWREGLVGNLLTNTAHHSEPWGQTRSALERLGQEICDRLVPALGRDERADKATAAWNARRQLSVADAVAATGLRGSSASVVTAHLEKGRLGRHIDINDVPNDELLAVGKMTASLPPSTVESIVKQLGAIPKRDRSKVDEASRHMQLHLQLPKDAPPHEQGYEIAGALREFESLANSDRFDPEAWLERVGVFVDQVNLGTLLVRALASWGPKHGPGILVNSAGQYPRTPSAIRIDLAHEICHLLVDREGAAPAADVLGGHSETAAEKRANAFAAELLLPRDQAAREFKDIYSEADTRTAVNRLTSRYFVSREVVAWQVRNSGLMLTDDVKSTLRTLVGRSDLY